MAGLTLITMATALLAQGTPSSLDQISGEAQAPFYGNPTAPAQIEAGSTQDGAPPQLTSGVARQGSTPQLTPGMAGRSPTRQLSASRPDASGAPALSSARQGRNVAVGRLAGHDRCDPHAGPSAKSPECARPIERRADDFARPPEAEPLTAEQRLLMYQAAEPGADARVAARRLNQGEVSGSMAAEAVASGYAAREEARPPEPTLSPAAAAALSVLTGQPAGSTPTVTSGPR